MTRNAHAEVCFKRRLPLRQQTSNVLLGGPGTVDCAVWEGKESTLPCHVRKYDAVPHQPESRRDSKCQLKKGRR